MANEEKIPDVVSDASEKITTVSDKVADMKASASESIAKVSDSVKSVITNVRSYSNTNSGGIIVMLVIGAAIALITAYILYWLINRTINNRNYYLLPGTSMPIIATQETKIDGSQIPGSLNGNRSTICFWIYIYDINKYSGSIKHVLHRGAENDDYTVASPYIYLDANTNKLHVTFASKSSDSKSVWGGPLAAQLFDPVNYTPVPAPSTGATTTPYRTYSISPTGKYVNTHIGNPSINTNVGHPENYLADASELPSDAAKLAYINAIRGITINYVPLQRWVHIGIVVNENLNGGSITAYVDGQLDNQITSQSQISIADSSIQATTSSFGTNSIFQVKSITTQQGNSIQLTQATTTAPVGGAKTLSSTSTAPSYGNPVLIKPSFSIANADLDRKGDIYIGGSLSSAMGPGFSGLISKIQFFNYDLNIQDVYNNYLKGPIDNLMAKLGLPPYGVRSPVYPLS